jgi:hypothetical protein
MTTSSPRSSKPPDGCHLSAGLAGSSGRAISGVPEPLLERRQVPPIPARSARRPIFFGSMGLDALTSLSQFVGNATRSLYEGKRYATRLGDEGRRCRHRTSATRPVLTVRYEAKSG